MNERPIRFAANVDPSAPSLGDARAIARRADELGLDLIGIQDHPYQWRFLDTWMLMATLLAETEQIHGVPERGESAPARSDRHRQAGRLARRPLRWAL